MKMFKISENVSIITNGSLSHHLWISVDILFAYIHLVSNEIMYNLWQNNDVIVKIEV